MQNQLKQYRVGGEWFIFENLDAWHKIVEQLPLIETLEMFKNTRVPNVGRPRKYTDIPDHLTPSQLALYLNITRQQAHQLLKRWRSEPHSKGHF